MSIDKKNQNLLSTVFITDKVLSELKPKKLFNYHQNASITSLDFNDSGRFLISSGIDKTIQIYDVYNGVHHKEVQSKKYGTHCAKFTHEELNCLYASTSEHDQVADGTIRYVSLENNMYIRYFKDHQRQVIGIEVNPLNDTFMSSSLDKTVRLWDLRVSNSIGNMNVFQPVVIGYDPQGMVFAVGKFPDPKHKTHEGTVSIFDLRNFDRSPFLTIKIQIIPGQIWNKLEFSNDGRYILISSNSTENYLIDAFLGKLLTILKNKNLDESKFMLFDYPYNGSGIFSPCGKFVIIGFIDQSILLFDLNLIKSTEGNQNVIDNDSNPQYLAPFKSIHYNFGVPKIIAFNPKLLNVAVANTSVSLMQPD